MDPLIIIINDQSKLDLFIAAIKRASIIALDTEFTRKTTYYPLLSTLQICTEENIAYIADFLEFPALTKRVFKVIYQSNAKKVFHACQNDLEIFYNLMKQLPTHVFDTQIAYLALSSIENISYSKLIENLFNITLNKNCRLSNWNIRPISKAQLKYASLDVIMLYKAYFKVYEMLKTKNRLIYIQEKIHNLMQESNYQFDLTQALKKFIIKNKIKKNYPLLAALILWREKTAQSLNIPKQHILKDDHIKEMVKTPATINKYYFNNIYFTPIEWNSIQQNLSYYNKYNSLLKKVLTPPHPALDPALNLLEHITKLENINKELICSKKELNYFLTYFTTTQSYYKILQNKSLKPFFIEWRYNIFTKKLINLLKILNKSE